MCEFGRLGLIGGSSATLNLSLASQEVSTDGLPVNRPARSEWSLILPQGTSERMRIKLLVWLATRIQGRWDLEVNRILGTKQLPSVIGLAIAKSTETDFTFWRWLCLVCVG